jgi:hypothetical protein
MPPTTHRQMRDFQARLPPLAGFRPSVRSTQGGPISPKEDTKEEVALTSLANELEPLSVGTKSTYEEDSSTESMHSCNNARMSSATNSEGHLGGEERNKTWLTSKRESNDRCDLAAWLDNSSLGQWCDCPLLLGDDVVDIGKLGFEDDADGAALDSTMRHVGVSGDHLTSWGPRGCFATTNISINSNPSGRIQPHLLSSGSSTFSSATESFPDEPRNDIGLFPEGDSVATIDPIDDGTNTFMLRNIPPRVRTEDLLERIRSLGFGQSFDFFYMPLDLKSKKNKGYAFINLTDENVAAEFLKHVNGTRFDDRLSSKEISVCKAAAQGIIPSLLRITPERRSKRNPGPLVRTDGQLMHVTPLAACQMLRMMDLASTELHS